MESRFIVFFFLFCFIGTVTAGLSQDESIVIRAKRQWGMMPWQQQQFQNSRNHNNIAAQQQKYNCHTQGINLIGLPISSYNCQNSGMSAKVNMLQQQQSNSGFMQGPFGGFLNGFMGRK